MTGLWLEYLFGDEKAIQMLPPKDAEQAQSNMGPWNGCTWGTAYCKLDWQGGLSASPSTRASEGLERKHNALGLRPGNSLNMRVWNCWSIKRIRTWNENIAGMGRVMAQNTCRKQRQPLGPHPRVGSRAILFLLHTHALSSSCSQLTSSQHTPAGRGDIFPMLFSLDPCQSVFFFKTYGNKQTKKNNNKTPYHSEEKVMTESHHQGHKSKALTFSFLLS